MPADDNDILELSSSTLPNSQEESTVPPSLPDLSTQKKKWVTSPGGTFTPQRSRRVRCEEANKEEVVILNDDESVLEADAEERQQEKDYVYCSNRKQKRAIVSCMDVQLLLRCRNDRWMAREKDRMFPNLGDLIYSMIGYRR
jgi:hypothetical protein